MNESTPDCFYRISVKALITDSAQKFLLVKEANGMWELPGGGLEHGETPQQALTRELHEEMGLTVVEVEQQPSFFLIAVNAANTHFANVVYLSSVADLNFVPSNECVEIRFFSADEVLKEKHVYNNVVKFAKHYR